MAGWCEIEEGDCGEVIGGWNDATLYRWRGGFASDRVNGKKDGARRTKRDEREETERKRKRSRESERGEREGGDHSHLEV